MRGSKHPVQKDSPPGRAASICKSKTPLQATGHLSCSAPRGGVFGLRSASVGAKRVPLAHSAPRGSRQMDMQACPLGSLLAGIKKKSGTAPAAPRLCGQTGVTEPAFIFYKGILAETQYFFNIYFKVHCSLSLSSSSKRLCNRINYLPGSYRQCSKEISIDIHPDSEYNPFVK